MLHASSRARAIAAGLFVLGALVCGICIGRASVSDAPALSGARELSEAGAHMCSTMPTFKLRNDLGHLLQTLGPAFTVGAELGVQKGHFAMTTLKTWANCRKYVLVDLWAHQANYKDLANVDEQKQDRYYTQTRNNLAPYAHKTEFCRNYTTSCVHNYPDGHFDYIYVDALHDFKGVYRDLRTWWPKLRDGGIFAGHDYVGRNPSHASPARDDDRRATHPCSSPLPPLVAEQNDGPNQTRQDWTLNYDGARSCTSLIRTRARSRRSPLSRCPIRLPRAFPQARATSPARSSRER